MGEVGRQVFERRSKEQGKQQRQALDALRSLTFHDKTHQRYLKARNLFCDFLTENWLKLPTRREALDTLVAEYVEFVWQEREGRALALDTVAGLQDADPKLKGHLQLTWRLLKT